MATSRLFYNKSALRERASISVHPRGSHTISVMSKLWCTGGRGGWVCMSRKSSAGLENITKVQSRVSDSASPLTVEGTQVLNSAALETEIIWLQREASLKLGWRRRNSSGSDVFPPWPCLTLLHLMISLPVLHATYTMWHLFILGGKWKFQQDKMFPF